MSSEGHAMQSVALASCLRVMPLGSTPFNHQWPCLFVSRWEAKNYKKLIERTTGRETTVDALLKNEFTGVSAKRFDTDRLEYTLILLTGDGNARNEEGVNDYDRQSFPAAVQQALLNGFNVEVWSWRKSTSKVYVDMWKHLGNKLKLCYLDEYRHYLVRSYGASGQGGRGGGVAQRPYQFAPQRPPSHQTPPLMPMPMPMSGGGYGACATPQPPTHWSPDSVPQHHGMACYDPSFGDDGGGIYEGGGYDGGGGSTYYPPAPMGQLHNGGYGVMAYPPPSMMPSMNFPQAQSPLPYHGGAYAMGMPAHPYMGGGSGRLPQHDPEPLPRSLCLDQWPALGSERDNGQNR